MSSRTTGDRPSLALLPNWLGDLVMAGPALRCLKEEGPVVGVGAPALLHSRAGLGFDRRGGGLRPPRERPRDCGDCGARPGASGPIVRIAPSSFHRPFVPPSWRFSAVARAVADFPGTGVLSCWTNPIPRRKPPRSRHQARVWRSMARGEALEKSESYAPRSLQAGPAAQATLRDLRLAGARAGRGGTLRCAGSRGSLWTS